MTDETEDRPIRYPNYGATWATDESSPFRDLVTDAEAKAHFKAAVAEYLRENLSIELQTETGWYDSDTKTVTVTLKLAGDVLAEDYIYV